MLKYDPQHFSDVYGTDLGKKIWNFLNEHDNLVRMETASYLRRPALEPLSEHLEKRFGEDAFDPRYKQMTGHMIRKIMEARGYRLDQNGVRITTENNRFSTAARYGRPRKD